MPSSLLQHSQDATVGIQSFWENVAVGAVLIVAVYVDQTRRRSRARR
jgi:ribose transport system permease protein